MDFLRTTEDPFGSAGILILRLAVGGMMLTHGWPKLGRLLETPDQFADPIGVGPEISLGLAVFAELLCSVLIVAGAATRLVVVPLLVTMLVAAFIAHGADPFAKKELPLLYASGCAALFFLGGGRFSVDALWRRRRLQG